jgi:hypothetical protein
MMMIMFRSRKEKSDLEKREEREREREEFILTCMISCKCVEDKSSSNSDDGDLFYRTRRTRRRCSTVKALSLVRGGGANFLFQAATVRRRFCSQADEGNFSCVLLMREREH